MNQIRGASTRLTAYTEDTFATAPAVPSGLVLPFTQDNVKPSQNRDQDETIDGYRGMTRSVGGDIDVSGNVQCNMAPQSIGMWLKHLFGAPTTTTNANGTYTHEFIPAFGGANALPEGLLLERDYGASMTAAKRFLQFLGCRINQGQFQFGSSGFGQAQFDVMGAKYQYAAAALDATPDDNGHSAFRMLSQTLTFNGGAPIPMQVVKHTFTANNNLDGATYVIGSNGQRGGLTEGKLAISGSIDTLLVDDGLISLQVGDTDTSLQQVFTSGDGSGSAGNEQLTLDIPALVFAVDAAVVNGPKGLHLTGSYTAHRTAGEIGVKFTLLSPLATIN